MIDGTNVREGGNARADRRTVRNILGGIPHSFLLYSAVVYITRIPIEAGSRLFGVVNWVLDGRHGGGRRRVCCMRYAAP